MKKLQNFPFCPENKNIPNDEYNDFLKKIMPKNCAKAKKLICDCTDKKNYLVHYRMLKFYVRHGMIVDKIHEINSFEQSKWLEKFIYFITQKRKKAKMDFEQEFHKNLITHFMERHWKKYVIVLK